MKSVPGQPRIEVNLALFQRRCLIFAAEVIYFASKLLKRIIAGCLIRSTAETASAVTVEIMSGVTARELLRRGGIGLVLLLLCLVTASTSRYFLTWDNIRDILKETSVNTIIAVGMTFVIVTAGIDLSVGSVLALSSVILGWAVITRGIPTPVSIALCLLTGTACGLTNGSVVVRWSVPSFIVTLGMMFAARGLTLLITHSQRVSTFPGFFQMMGTGEVPFIHLPMPALIAIVTVVAGHIILTRTTFGRYALAVGSSEEAARLSGLNVKLIKLIVFAGCGFATALAGLVNTSRLDAAIPTSGAGFELEAIAAVIIGGTSLMGGKGTVIGTFFGALIMGVIRNGLNLHDTPDHIRMIVIGAVVVLAVVMDFYRRQVK